jgi:intracellular sulfur oxidation DsrE/DsrF family protein
MRCQVLFHLDWNEADGLNMALNNISNLLKDPFGQSAEICVVANGEAVKLFQKSSAMATAARISQLHARGVRFALCGNSLAGQNIGRDELVEGCEVVQAGIVELIRLQQAGFAYVKP